MYDFFHCFKVENLQGKGQILITLKTKGIGEVGSLLEMNKKVRERIKKNTIFLKISLRGFFLLL